MLRAMQLTTNVTANKLLDQRRSRVSQYGSGGNESLNSFLRINSDIPNN